MTALSAILGSERFTQDDPAPLYLRLQSAIREAVGAGSLAPGDALPPERELASELGISRVTVRKALAGLVEAGILQQRRGSGTYVAPTPHRMEQPLSRLTSFTEDMRARGFRPTVQVIDRRVSLPSPEEAMVFGLKVGERVTRLHRLRLADGVPMAIEMAVVPQAFLPDPDLVDQSLYAVLEARGIRPVRALQRLAATNIAATEAALLEVPVGSATLRIERVSYLADGRVVEFTRSYYRGDAYDFVAELNLGADH
ncbi:GntR family transcriptional regulator [Chthonobacter albigriseus]|uniref:GntR family transcriptional regulator n=1 Tax=Chthonobacter albigriseus TaxID=1683161 RepID=UPI0015EED828|nr:GntR family transcriptional regulator [Chthonobacter albigriseus]